MIYFNNFPSKLVSIDLLLSWLHELAHYYDSKISSLQYNFVDESYLLEMNKTYLNHDTHTDIITFSYGSTTSIEAEIFISIDRMIENAVLYSETTDKEMIRLISHGFLHCVGFKDASRNEKDIMQREENRCIQMFHVKQSNDV